MSSKRKETQGLNFGHSMFDYRGHRYEENPAKKMKKTWGVAEMKKVAQEWEECFTM